VLLNCAIHCQEGAPIDKKLFSVRARNKSFTFTKPQVGRRNYQQPLPPDQQQSGLLVKGKPKKIPPIAAVVKQVPSQKAFSALTQSQFGTIGVISEWLANQLLSQKTEFLR
jgi:hypothetical protein